MIVAGTRSRMPPPAMLRIVMSFPVDGAVVVSVEAEAVPVMSMGETGAEVDQYERIQEMKNDQAYQNARSKNPHLQKWLIPDVLIY